jgi:uncharacterized protein
MFSQSNHMSPLMKASLYFVIALGLAVVVAAIMVSVPSVEAILGDIDLYMLTPVTAVLLMMLLVTRDGFTRKGWEMLGLHRLGLPSWGFAVLAPAILLFCTYFLTWVLGIGKLDLSSTPALSRVISLFFMQIIISAGEEIGWRGYLLPHLQPLGRTWALLLSGLCHGLWHLPIMLMTPFYHASGNRLIVVTLFLLTLTAAGVVYGYLRLKSQSLWPAVLSHATLNTLVTYLSTVTIAVTSAEELEYWAGETGVFSLIGITLLAGWLLYRTTQQAPRAARPMLATESQ